MANCKMINGWPYSVMVLNSPHNFAIFFNGQSGCRQYTVAQRFHGASTNIHWTANVVSKKPADWFQTRGFWTVFWTTVFHLKIRDVAMMTLYGFFGGHVGRNRSSPQSGPGEACGKKAHRRHKSLRPLESARKIRENTETPTWWKETRVANAIWKKFRYHQLSIVIQLYFCSRCFFLNYILPVRIISFQLNPVVLKLTNVGAAHEQ